MGQITVISIPVKDQKKSKDFYMEILEFNFIHQEQFDENKFWIQLAPSEGETSICLTTWFKSMSPGSLKGLVLGTRNFDEDYCIFSGRGLNLGKIVDSPWGRSAIFSDPDGNEWVLQEIVGFDNK